MTGTLFNFKLGVIILISGINANGNVLNESIQILAYGKDIIRRSESANKEYFLQLQETSKTMGPELNIQNNKLYNVKTNSSRSDATLNFKRTNHLLSLVNTNLLYPLYATLVYQNN